MRTSSKLLIAIILLSLAGGLVYTYTLYARRNTVPVSLQLKWLHQAQFAGIYTAHEKGLYQKNHLKVTILPGGPNISSITNVNSGAADFGVAGADDLLIAISQGKPLVALAVIYQKSPVVYFAFSKTGIRTPFDFAGKRVGYRQGTGTYYSYLAMLNNLNIDRGTITEIPVEAGIGPLINGKVDVLPGFLTNEPKLVEDQGFPVTLIKPEDYGVDIYADVLFTRKDVLKKSPGLAASFVEATLAGWEYALSHQEEAIDYVMRYSKNTPREHQKFMLRESAPLIKPTEKTRVGLMNHAGWEKTYELLKKYEVIASNLHIEDVFSEAVKR